MARKSPTILQEELYPAPEERVYAPPATPAPSREDLDDARLVDLDVDEGSPFLRAQKRVSARRTSLPKKTAHWLLWASALGAVAMVVALIAGGIYSYGEHSWRFRLQSSDDIEIAGMQNVTRAQVMEVMGADIGRNIFFIPLSQQKAQLEQIPWVESASVMRFVPNRLKIDIHERTPVAFARVGSRISLIDAGGTLMELPHNHKYSFPVILGMYPGEPLSTRAPRMKAYNQLVRDLDSSGAHYSQELSEVDVSDLDDLKVRVNDPAGDVLVELGSVDYLKRYKIYVTHVQEWRQQFQKLVSVNLRYENQVIVNPDMEGKPKPPVLSAAAAKAAAAAGVKPAALVTKIDPHDKTIPKPAFELSPQTLSGKPAAVKKPAKAKSVAGKTAAAASHRTVRAKHSRPEAGATKATRKAAAPVATSPKPSPAIVKPAGGPGE
ncbi:MAG TPA: FtsQ-type POTRA domain-containing protein [Candidatus Sulfotelmatobacter sp.]|nr:FtsQ-type POTRA domain-containing protein [Candidatus Sulfotelmatobacter sp.]